MSGEIHNIQVTLGHITHVQKAVEAQYNNPQNVAAAQAAIAELRRQEEARQVRELDEADEAQAEDERYSHIKKHAQDNLPKRKGKSQDAAGRTHIDIDV
ncbi:MAG: hypothetical protein RRB13_13355 [bacterium]|nr:hypothetical protein [bacterium]